MNDLLPTIKELIINFAVLTAFLFVTSQIVFRKKALIQSQLSLREKLMLGTACGVLGSLLMFFTVSINNTILDIRQLAIILSALGGGVYSSLVAGLMISVVRLVNFGSITTGTILAAANSMVVALFVGYISTTRMSYWRQWTFALSVAFAATTIVFFVNLGEQGLKPVMIYFFMMAIGGLFTAYMVLYLMKAKRYSLRMEKEATVDFLTGLSNHRTFDSVYNSCLSNAIEKKEHFSLLLIDIDHFKKINDTYGHPNGDALLKHLGEVLKDSARQFDVVSRIGGEEFSVILLDCPLPHALLIAERIRAAVEGHHFVLNDGTETRVTVSIGAATLDSDNRDQLLEQADISLYKAKQGGRNQVYPKIENGVPNRTDHSLYS